MFFGKDNTYSKSGNSTYVSGNRGNSHITDSKNMSFSSDGRSMAHSGKNTFTSGGQTITGNGHQYFANGKTYTKSGNMLFSSDGKSWTGQMSDRDIRNIIHNDNPNM